VSAAVADHVADVRAQVGAAARVLTAAGVASARHDAEALAAHVLGVPRSSLLLCRDALDASQYDALVARRAAREPLQHIVGRAAFRHLELAVGPGVFVPRPETEVVVDAALAAIVDRPAPVVVDLCAGSGAIALAIAAERPDAVVHAVELSDDAVQWLRRNIESCAPAVNLVVADITDPALLTELDGRVDLVASNPPYLPTTSLDQLAPEVRDHDPAPALFGGADGLALIPAVTTAAWRLLRAGGTVVVEHGDDQGEAVPAVLRLQGFADVTDHRDLVGRDRFATAIRPDGHRP
jgi:release factor glutamine methyltransferase